MSEIMIRLEGVTDAERGPLLRELDDELKRVNGVDTRSRAKDGAMGIDPHTLLLTAHVVVVSITVVETFLRFHAKHRANKLDLELVIAKANEEPIRLPSKDPAVKKALSDLIDASRGSKSDDDK